MRTSIKIGLIFSSMLITIRLIFYFLKIEISEKPIMLLSMFFITASSSIGLYLSKRIQTQYNTLIDDLKTAMAPAMIFTVLACGFSYIYYNNIDTAYIANKLKEEEARWDDPNNIKELKLKNPVAYDNLSNDEIKSQQLNTAKTLLSPSFNMSISLLIMSIWSILNGLVLGLIFRRVIFKDYFESVSPKES